MGRLATWPDNYVASWGIICLVAVVIAWLRRHAWAESYRGYFRFLFVRWKLVTFVAALLGITLIAPYTGDIYWDYTVAAVMAIGSFVTAPWALAVLWRFARRMAPVSDAFVAACAWMFTSSWSYDGWNYMRLGHYPLTWEANISASSFLYVMAGAFWSFDHRDGRPRVAFLSASWPGPSADGAFLRLLPWLAPIMGLVAFLIVGFVFDWLG
jgi:hypothetical protein